MSEQRSNLSLHSAHSSELSDDTLNENVQADKPVSVATVQADEKQAAQNQANAPPGPPNPSQFPDGGLKAWLCVAGGFCTLFCSFGWVNAIGVFQEYYERDLLASYSPSTISWILSLEVFFMFFGAPIIGRTYDAYGPRWLLLTGTFLHVFGLMMASLSTKYYQILLSQGICSPIGASLLLHPSLMSASTWFGRRRALALGIMNAGSSLGGIVFPIMVQRLIVQVGFPWTMRICAFMILGLLAFGIITVPPYTSPKSPKPFSPSDFTKPFHEPAFAVMCIGTFFGILGLFIPINYITLSGIGVGMSTTLATYLIPILNAGSILGRIFPSWVADKLGRFNMQIVMCIVSVVITLAIWLPATGNAPIIVYTVLYGFSSGTFVTLMSAIVAQITTDMRTIGVRMGAMFFCVSWAALIGNPIAGALVAANHGGYTYLQVFTGVAFAVATVFITVSKGLCKGKFWEKY